MEPSIKDLKRTAPDEYAYWLDLPDGRELTVAKILTNKFRQTRFGLEARAVPTWAWQVLDRDMDVVAQEKDFSTRQIAFDRGVRWSEENPKGTVEVEAKAAAG